MKRKKICGKKKKSSYCNTEEVKSTDKYSKQSHYDNLGIQSLERNSNQVLKGISVSFNTKISHQHTKYVMAGLW